MTSLQDRVRGHKTQRLNQLENLIAVNDGGQLGIIQLKIVTNAIVKNHNKIDWIALDKGEGKPKLLKKLREIYNDDKALVYDINCD